MANPAKTALIATTLPWFDFIIPNIGSTILFMIDVWWTIIQQNSNVVCHSQTSSQTSVGICNCIDKLYWYYRKGVTEVTHALSRWATRKSPSLSLSVDIIHLHWHLIMTNCCWFMWVSIQNEVNYCFFSKHSHADSVLYFQENILILGCHYYWNRLETFHQNKSEIQPVPKFNWISKRLLTTSFGLMSFLQNLTTFSNEHKMTLFLCRALWAKIKWITWTLEIRSMRALEDHGNPLISFLV